MFRAGTCPGNVFQRLEIAQGHLAGTIAGSRAAAGQLSIRPTRCARLKAVGLASRRGSAEAADGLLGRDRLAGEHPEIHQGGGHAVQLGELRRGGRVPGHGDLETLLLQLPQVALERQLGVRPRRAAPTC